MGLTRAGVGAAFVTLQRTTVATVAVFSAAAGAHLAYHHGR